MFRKILNISTYIILFLSFIMLVIGYFVGFPKETMICFAISLGSSWAGINCLS